MCTVHWHFKSSLSRQESRLIQCLFNLRALTSRLAVRLGRGASSKSDTLGIERKVCVFFPVLVGLPSDWMESAPDGDGSTHLFLCHKQPSDLLVSRTFYFAHRFCGSGLRQGTMVSIASGVSAGKTRTAEGGLSAWGGITCRLCIYVLSGRGEGWRTGYSHDCPLGRALSGQLGLLHSMAAPGQPSGHTGTRMAFYDPASDTI